MLILLVDGLLSECCLPTGWELCIDSLAILQVHERNTRINRGWTAEVRSMGVVGQRSGGKGEQVASVLVDLTA